MHINFEHTKTKIEDNSEVYSLKVYKGFDDKKLGYVDTLTPMSLEELQELKKYLSEIIWKDCNY